MATRSTYRAELNNKLLSLEDGGYGDFEYTDDQLNFYLDMACVRMFPAVYQKVAATVPGGSIVAYGSGTLGYVLNTAASGINVFPVDRVYGIDDAFEFDPVVNWQMRADRIVGLEQDKLSTYGVILYYYDSYNMPTNDTSDAGIPDLYDGLINLGALIEAVESRQDTGVRGEPQPTGQFAEVSLLDRLTPRYEKLRQDLALSLPAMQF